LKLVLQLTLLVLDLLDQVLLLLQHKAAVSLHRHRVRLRLPIVLPGWKLRLCRLPRC